MCTACLKTRLHTETNSRRAKPLPHWLAKARKP
jgi:hypothetical protein